MQERIPPKGNKTWCMFHVVSAFGGKPYWMMSSRKLTLGEQEKIWNMSRHAIDLFDLGLDYAFNGCAIISAIRFGGTKKQALAYLDRLNDGENPFEGLLNAIGEDVNEE